MPLPFLILAAVLLVIGLGAGTAAIAYSGGKPVKIELKSIGGGYQLRADAATDFIRMKGAAAAQGVLLYVNSAFRSMGEQESLFAKFEAGTGALAAKPGYSNHQSGIAVDIDVDNSPAHPTYQWLAANAARYGFINTGKSFSPPEYWHWEYRA